MRRNRLSHNLEESKTSIERSIEFSFKMVLESTVVW